MNLFQKIVPNESTIVAALDIGTKVVKILVFKKVSGETFDIIGYKHCSSEGIEKASVFDPRKAYKMIHTLLSEVEVYYEVKISKAILSLSGKHLSGFSTSGSANVASMDGFVRDVDMDRAINDASGKELPDGRVYVYQSPTSITLDGRRVASPLNCHGHKVEVDHWSVHMDESVLQTYIQLINGYSVEVCGLSLSSLSSAYALTTEQERKAGVLVIDIGAGTTDYSLFSQGWLMQTGCIAVGGDHITNDLAMGLRISVDQAEQLKLKYGSAVVNGGPIMQRVAE